VQPALDLAKNGFIVSGALANQLETHKELIQGSTELSAIFIRNSELVSFIIFEFAVD
jgi:gamma-glutamyltranspeptidase